MGGRGGADKTHHSFVSKSQQHVIESALLASEIERLPDLSKSP